ncbi:MAG: hypothetical protein PSX80_02040 [bacterium]|nr:hypothetical protein [bacterium]
MESPIERITLADIPVGGRLLVRSKKDWRVAVVSRKTDEFISISIASPSGYNYRIRRTSDVQIFLDGLIPFLPREESEPWRENFTGYDVRW